MPKITKLQTKYILEDGHCKISVISHEEADYKAFMNNPIKSLSIYRQEYFNGPFEFKKSDPKTIKAIANLLLEAVKLAE